MCDSKENPAIVISHAAWHPPPMYQSFVAKLKSASYEAIVPALPSCDSSDPANATCTKDAEVVRKAIMPLLDEGKDVVVIAHSYGGIPAAGSVEGLSKIQRRREGKPGGVIGLVYMSAFVVPENVGILTMMGGKHAPCVIQNQPSEYNSILADPRHIMFNDLSDAEAEQMAGMLRPQSLKALDSPAPPPAWAEPEFAGRLGFIRCMQDQALPLSVQDQFMEKSRVAWKVMDLDAGHDAELGKSDEIIKIIDRWVKEWQA